MLLKVFRKKVLISVCCIDERAFELKSCLLSLLRSMSGSVDILGVVRKRDIICQLLLRRTDAVILTVEDYTTPSVEETLALKRSLALDYARQHGYDLILFVDSDIRVRSTTLSMILLGSLLGADIVCIPYGIRRAGGPERIEKVSSARGCFPFHRCAAAGMGCTAIAVRSPRVPRRFAVGEALGVKGEDIGFFLEARELGARVLAASWYTVEHVAGGEAQ